jgi:glucoamylase
MVWFTLCDGVVTEVYYPRVDQANVRDMALVITAEPGFFSDESTDTTHQVEILADGVPAYRLTNRCVHGRFAITKTIVTDPERNVLLQRTHFQPLRGALTDYHVFAILSPHIANQGARNTGWVGNYKGVAALFAQRDGSAMALTCSAPFKATSCGFVGVNDGRLQLARNGSLIDRYGRARHGNIALTAEIDCASCGGEFVLALGFGHDSDEAGSAARAALVTDFDTAYGAFADGWRRFHGRSRTDPPPGEVGDAYRASVTTIQVHEDKVRRGAFIASLSIPWGNDRGDHDRGGYQFVWPRDLVEGAGAMLAAGHTDAARHALHYLITTQEGDGHWPQNMRLDGRAYWRSDQLDETALPILLADQLRRRRALGSLAAWPMVRAAAAYIARTGPVTTEDRWEEDGGYATFTLAVEIAALLAAADFADIAGECSLARYFRDTADYWNESIERWTYVTNTPLAARAGVSGHYVRIAPEGVEVSPDALALVRFGLRAADDERILNTVRVVDGALRTMTPTGPAWHRYNDDGYGEHEDGSAFDGSGVGRGWPLLAGERAHYELAAGRAPEAAALLGAMCRQRGAGGLLPEQVWDADDIPARGLFAGHPSLSAMPLVWAHAELIKLVRSLHDGRVFDTPPQTVKRYLRARAPARLVPWRYNHKLREMPAGKMLRIETRAPAMVHWSADGWRHVEDSLSRDTGIGLWAADLPTGSLPVGAVIRFTFFWPEPQRWEGVDFSVHITAAG